MWHSFSLGCSDGQLSPQADASLGVTAGSHPAQGPKCSSGESGRQRADAVVGVVPGAKGEASWGAAHCLVPDYDIRSWVNKGNSVTQVLPL